MPVQIRSVNLASIRRIVFTKVLNRPTLVLNPNWQAVNVATVARAANAANGETEYISDEYLRSDVTNPTHIPPEEGLLLALVDERMPVVCALPDDPLLEKVLSNLQEVRARGGELFLFSDKKIQIPLDRFQNLTLDDICPGTAPIVYTIPLQLLSYHVAVLKGTDVDQPRNLAKSVTVE